MGKNKSTLEQKKKDFDELFSFPTYSQKSEEDSTKLDSDEEDPFLSRSPDDDPSFNVTPKSIEKTPRKTPSAKKVKADGTPKPKRPPKPKKTEELFVTSDAELNFETPKQTMTPKGKGKGRKRKNSGSENEGEYNPGKKRPKSTSSKKSMKASFDNDSDGDILPPNFGSESTTDRQPRAGRARKEVKYFAESDDDDDDFAMFN